MPVLPQIPVPHPVVTFARAIEAAALATLEQDPAVKEGGSLGVVTVEKMKVQADGESVRDFGGKSELPSVSVRCWNTGTSAGATAGSRHLHFLLEIVTVTEDAAVSVARQANDDIQGVAVYALLETIRTKPNTWLDGVTGVFLYVDEESTDMDTPSPREGVAGRFEGRARIPISVLWSNWEVW